MTTINATPSASPKPPSVTPRSHVPRWMGPAFILWLLLPAIWMTLHGDLPAPTSINGFKGMVNALSVPEWSLSCFFLPVLVMMMVYYRSWTRLTIFVPMLIGFCILYFGSMAIDPNYRLILQKADNVPITMMLLGTIICLWTAFRQAAINDTRLEAGLPLLEQDREDKVLCWPDLVYTEMLCIVIASAILVIWAVALPAPLESPANPAGPPNPSKAPWYFLGLQEMLVYFDPWMAGVLLPGLIITGLISTPYIDTNPRGNGYYTLKQRPFSIFVWLFGFLILWVVLIVFGTFLRGPNWNFFGPYQYWDPHLQVPLTNINLSQYFWIFGLHKPEPTAAVNGPFYMLIRELPGFVLIFCWIFILPVVLAKTVMRRMYTQLGSIRFYIMAFHLVVMGLLPLKMVLRWLFVLKYFVYLPEFNLNL